MYNSDNYPDPEIVYDCDELQLLKFTTNSDITLITFDIMHAKANGRNAFALNLARRLGLNYYAFVPKRPNWYPTNITQSIAQKIAAEKDRPSIGYGASMGGYGVLKHAYTLSTDATLAFSPQATISPEKTGDSDKRYTKYYHPDKNTNMDILDHEIGPNSYVICDPTFKQDRFQRSLLPLSIKSIDLPGIGHSSAAAMVPSRNAYANFLDALSAQSGTLEKRLVMASQDTLAYNLTQTRQALDESRPDDALRVINATIERHGEIRDALALRAQCYAATGDPNLGIEILRKILSENPNLVSIWRDLARLLEANGQMDVAIDELTSGLAASQNGFLALQLFKLLKKQDQRKAKKFARSARIQWPERARHFEV